MQQYVEIGSEKIPALGYGTFLLPEKECIEGVSDALHIGYRHIDTAQAYNNETEVGIAIQSSSVKREEIFLTTKVTPRNFPVEKFIPSVEESLKKLQVDSLDLLLLHWPSSPEDDKRDEIAVEQLALAQQKGYTRLVGVSNFTLRQMENARRQADIICNQVEYHPYFAQKKVMNYLIEHNMMLTAYRPLANGKIIADELIISLAEKYNHTPAQIVLRWFLQQKNVSVIPKAANEKNRRDNFNVFNFELSAEDMKSISALDTGKRMVDPPFAPKWDD